MWTNVNIRPLFILGFALFRSGLSLLNSVQDYLKLNISVHCYLRKNQNTPRPSEHPPVRGENIKTFRWDHRVQIQNLFLAFKRVPLW